MKKQYKMKKTISVKRLISQLGDNFSEHIKNRLLDLEVRCVLTREEDFYSFDIRHVEHIQYPCHTSEDELSIKQKEYSYGRLIVIDGLLYFSENTIENDEVMQSPIVSSIYNSMGSDGAIVDKGYNAKRIDDNNIDYIVDTMLTVFPQVSQSYLNIMSHIVID